jgi:hypothetical protein
MEEFTFSKHSIEQMRNRNISMEIVLKILEDPKEIIFENEQTIYQSIVSFENEKEYLVRIIVNSLKNPKTVITVYKTSKLKKYYES